jgi:hypothetical protein
MTVHTRARERFTEWLRFTFGYKMTMREEIRYRFALLRVRESK